MNRDMSDAIRHVTPSCGCIFCDLDLAPVKLRRRWVHHFPRTGQLVACDVRNLKSCREPIS